MGVQLGATFRWRYLVQTRLFTGVSVPCLGKEVLRLGAPSCSFKIAEEGVSEDCFQSTADPCDHLGLVPFVSLKWYPCLFIECATSSTIHLWHQATDQRCGLAKQRGGPDVLWSKQIERRWEQENTERVKKGRTGKPDRELSLRLNQKHILHSMELIVSPPKHGEALEQ